MSHHSTHKVQTKSINETPKIERDMPSRLAIKKLGISLKRFILYRRLLSRNKGRNIPWVKEAHIEEKMKKDEDHKSWRRCIPIIK